MKTTRREFLHKSALAIAMPAIIPASALGRDGTVAPSNRIALGAIGIGPRGRLVLDAFLKQPDAQFVTVCDVQASQPPHRQDDGRPAKTATRTASPPGTCWRCSAAVTSTRC